MTTAFQIFLMMTRLRVQMANVMTWRIRIMHERATHAVSVAVLFSTVLGLGVGSLVGVVTGMVVVVLMLHVWSVWAQLSSRLGMPVD